MYELSNLLVCACGQTMIGHTTTNKNGRYRYFHYYHNVPGYVQTHKGYLLDAAHSEAMANELLGRPICQDWQNRLAEIIKKRAPIIVNDRSAEKLARAKELYVAGDITKDEYQTIKNGMTARTEPPIETINMAALLDVINAPAAAWDHAQPQERYVRNRLLLKWIRMTKTEIVDYELTDLGKAVFKE